LDLSGLEEKIDNNTRVVAMGLASNATGRIHLDAVQLVKDRIRSLSTKTPPYLVLDGTHFVPHRRTSLEKLGADAVICSSYKFFGPHMGVMAFHPRLNEEIKPLKVGFRGPGEEPLLSYGATPSMDNCHISPWEMGTLNYEALTGFEELMGGYFKQRLGTDGDSDSDGQRRALDTAFTRIQQHEEAISERFLRGIQPLLQAAESSATANGSPDFYLRLHGSRDVGDRTPTFALSVQAREESSSSAVVPPPEILTEELNRRNIYCTHGNHYAPSLVDDVLRKPNGVTRVSFLHYNTLEEVDFVVQSIVEILEALNNKLAQ